MPTPALPLSPPDLTQRAAQALEGEFAAYISGLGALTAEVQGQLMELAADLASYWRLRAEGKEAEAEDLLEILRVTASLVAAGAALHATTESRLAAQRLIEILARLGSILLQGLLA